jgi:hypothetical protein
VSSLALLKRPRILHSFRRDEVSRRIEPDKLSEMELTLDFVSEIGPCCSKANLMSGFSTMMAYTCRECGGVVRLSDDPDVERYLGSLS